MGILLPILISAGLGLLGGVGQGIAANRQQWTEREAARNQRERLDSQIDEIENNADIMRLAHTYANQFSADSAARGVYGSGAETGRMATGVADVVAQKKLQEQQLINQILQDPAYQVTDAPVDMFGNVAINALGGAIGGAGTALGQTLGSQSGLDAWGDIIGGGPAPSAANIGSPGAFTMGTDPSGPAPVSRSTPNLPVGTQGGWPGMSMMDQSPTEVETPQAASQNFLNAFGLARGPMFVSPMEGTSPTNEQLTQFMSILANRGRTAGA